MSEPRIHTVHYDEKNDFEVFYKGNKVRYSKINVVYMDEKPLALVKKPLKKQNDKPLDVPKIKASEDLL